MRGNARTERLAFEQGMIEGWRHIRSICNCCIRAHLEEKKRLNRVRKDEWENPYLLSGEELNRAEEKAKRGR